MRTGDAITMDLQLKDKTILVTAASKGLGYSVAKALVHEGTKVIICSRSEESLKKATESLGEHSRYIVADLSKPEEVGNLLGISPSSLARWRCEGGGPRFVKLSRGRSGFIRYRRRDVEAFLEASSRNSTSDRGDAHGRGEG